MCDGKLDQTKLWKPNKKASAHANLWEFCLFVEGFISDTRVDMVIVELCAVSRNLNTVRVLSKYEAAAILAAKRQGKVVLQTRVSQARQAVLGDGGIKKEDAFVLMKKRFPAHAWMASNRGGMDETDAAVLALAGPDVAERG